MKNFKKISKGLFLATLFVLALGVVSYLTATGKAAIGPNPESVDAQRAAIAVNTAWWMAICFIGGVVAHTINIRRN